MKFILFFLFLFLGWLQNSQAQTRTDLPLYQAEQQKKQKTLYFLNQTLQKHEGIQTAQDSIKQKMAADSLQRYTLQQKQVQNLQNENRKSYRLKN